MHAGLILAAGSGSRFGLPKAIIQIDGIRLVDRAVSTFHQAGISDVFVVLGAWQGDVPGAHIVLNPNWQSGMGSSLRVGIERIKDAGIYSDVVISLVDIPGLTQKAVKMIAEDPSEITVGTYKGVRGHPVKIAEKYWPEVIDAASEDSGAKNFLRNRSDTTLIPLDDYAIGVDIDTQSDLSEYLK